MQTQQALLNNAALPIVPVRLPIWTEEELRYFVLQAFGIRIPDKQCCPNHCTPWRAFCDAFFCQHTDSVWKASRGFGGKSFLMALLGITIGLTIKADVSILGGSWDQARRVLNYITNDGNTESFWNYPNSPLYMLRSDVAQYEVKLVWGNAIKALKASSTSTRSGHPQKNFFDEVDEIPIDILDGAQGQSMSRDGIPQQNIYSSTEQYANGTMATIRRRAKQKGWGWYEWCFKENMEPHGWLSPVDIARKRSTVTAAMWETEYELQLPNPGTLGITTSAVEKMFRKDLGEYKGMPGEYIEIEPPMHTCPACHADYPSAALPPNEQCVKCGTDLEPAQYATGGDWARKVDWTVIWTNRIDKFPRRLVAFERLGRELWPAMVARFEARVNRYPGEVSHDATGIGDVVDGYINVEANGVQLTGQNKYTIVSNYVGAVERGEYEAPMIEWCYESHKEATRDDLFGSSAGSHLPDDICAAAMAHYAQDSAIQIGSL